MVSAQIWDTSGSERYRSIVLGHYRAAVGALLVFDLTDRDSWDSLKYWMDTLRENADENIQIALVANKCDLVEENQEARMVTKEEIVEFSKENNLMFFGETSAKNDKNIR